MKFVGRDTQNERMEIMELSGHPFYVAVQYHPEYISRPMKPSAPYLGLILAATGKLQSFLSMVGEYIANSLNVRNPHNVINWPLNGALCRSADSFHFVIINTSTKHLGL